MQKSLSFRELVAAHLTSNVGGLFLEIGSRKFSSAPSSHSRSSSSSLSADSSLYSTNLSSWVCPKKRAWTRDCSISGVARSFVAMFCSVPFACDEDTPNLCSVECGAFSASFLASVSPWHSLCGSSSRRGVFQCSNAGCGIKSIC